MNAVNRRMALWAGIAALVVVGLFYAFRPQPVPVDLATLAHGPLVVTVDEEGITRVRDIFVVSAPVTGRTRRIEAEVGDPVIRDETVLAEIEPIDPAFLDPRSEAQAQAELRVAEANQVLARARVAEAEADYDFARTEVARARQLIETDSISGQALDEAVRQEKTTRAALETAQAGLRARNSEYARAEARLISPAETQDSHGLCACVPLLAPVDGTVLRVLHESEGVVEAGEPLIEIGDPGALEIVTDYLSSDAVRIEPGQRVMIEDWGGEDSLAGHVRRVEPFGFTKVSALGIEEQRANVIIDFEASTAGHRRLGHGYRVETRVVLWEGEDVLKVPLTALFRNGGDWAVFVQRNGKARLRAVATGGRDGIDAEVIDGLAEGERVILSPSDRIADGVRVVARD
ncbi:MAG: HlyD family efflux transporter periplasmic adaptor subunit [Gammaproteobacteria bacterium]|nr:HlyD family efflux transporter periplasmic adaptor subunit [Gammaproteobacteria bacterium]